MEAQIESFIEYCHNVKGTSQNTELSYRRDLYQLAEFSACPVSDDQGRGSDCDGIIWLYPFSGKKAEKSCDDFP